MLFPLKFRATIERKVESRDSLTGQVLIDSYQTIVESVPCLFLTTSGNRKTVAHEDFESNNSFYCNAGVDIHEGDRIVNIRLVNGAIVEEGPFQVRSAKEVPNHLTGTIDHISCRLTGVAA